jgi:hypothetical protein
MKHLIELIIAFFTITKKDDLYSQARLTTLIRIVPVSQHGYILFSKDIE